MSGSDPTLEVLIKVREELAGLNKTRAGIEGVKKDAEGLATQFRQGFGLGTGMDLARRGIDLVTRSLQASVGEAFRLAETVKDGSEALGVTAEAYQVIKFELANAGVEMARFAMAVNTQTESLAAARAGAGAAARAYQDLGLSAAALEQMSPEERVFAVARAVEQATDKTRAFSAAGQILGSRGLPQLVNGLKDVAKNYDAVRDAAREAGRVMNDETIARLDQAKKQINHFTQTTLPVTVGTGIGWVHSALESMAGAAANVVNQLQGRPRGDLGPAPSLATPKVGGNTVAAAQEEDVILARIANAQSKAGAFQNAPLYNSEQRRKALLPVLKEQEELYQQLIKVKFGDKDHGLHTNNAEVTEEELNRYKQRNEMEEELTRIRQERQNLQDKPILAM